MDRDEDVPMGHHDTAGSSTGESIEVNGHADSTDPSITMEITNTETYEDQDRDDEEEDEQMIDQAMSESPPQVLGLSLAAMPGGGINDTDGTSASSNRNSEAVRTPIESTKPQVVIQHFADPALPYASSRTGLVYDARMRFHTELGASEDDIHPEDPRRIWEIFNELVQAGLVDDDSEPNAPFHPFRLMRIQARLAEPAEICLVHSRKHYEWVEDLESQLLSLSSLSLANLV
jgi:histone deacetylase 6